MGTEAFGGLGDVPYRDLHRLTARYRFLFSPMRYTSLPLAVVEAMSIGMPVVALATTALPDVIQDGVNGYISTDPDVLVERMKALIADPELARALGQRARETARERFGLDRFRAEWDDALHAAIELETGADTGASGAATMTRRVAMISEHASPVALLGGVDAGGQNVYVDAVSRGLVAHGYETDVFTVRGELEHPEVVAWADGVRVSRYRSVPPLPCRKTRSGPTCRRSATRSTALPTDEGAAYDLIHGNFWMSGWVAAELGSRWQHPDGADLPCDRCHQAARARRGGYQPRREDRGREGRRAGGRSPDRPMPRRTGRAAG